MRTTTTYPHLGVYRTTDSFPWAILLGLVFMAGLICLVSAWSLQARGGMNGYSSAALYNQGNAYAREGKTASAILSYEQARLLASDDTAIAANLRWLREKASLPQAAGNWLDQSVSWASPNAFAYLGCLGLTLVGVGVLASGALPRSRNLFFIGIVAGVLLLVPSLISAFVTWDKASLEVVTKPDAAARISPTSVGETSFKLQPGQLVVRQGQYHNFALVHDSDGHTGWLEQTNLEQIIPHQPRQDECGRL